MRAPEEMHQNKEVKGRERRRRSPTPFEVLDEEGNCKTPRAFLAGLLKP